MLSVLSSLVFGPLPRRAHLPWVVVPLLAVSGWPGALPLAAAGPQANPKAPAVPSALRAAYIASVQTEAATNPAYHVDSASRTAHNPRQKLAAHLDAAGIQLVDNAGKADFQSALALASYGCAAHPVATQKVLPRSAQNRTEYLRDGLTEWYVNGPLGLEQGFTLAQAPACGAAHDVVLNLDWDTNLSPTLVAAPAAEAAGDRIELRNAEGTALLTYSDLYAYDAAGKRLPAQLGTLDQAEQRPDAAREKY